MTGISATEGANNATIWLLLGNEAMQCITDLRWGVVLVFVLIFTDYHFGCAESKMKYLKAKGMHHAEYMDKYRFHLSRAIRRSFNKFSDYLLMLLVGCIIGLAITEPMGICSHTIAAATGLIVATICEVSSIIGHLLVLKGVQKPTLTWGSIGRYTMKVASQLVKEKSKSLGNAMDEATKETFEE